MQSRGADAVLQLGVDDGLHDGFVGDGTEEGDAYGLGGQVYKGCLLVG